MTECNFFEQIGWFIQWSAVLIGFLLGGLLALLLCLGSMMYISIPKEHHHD